MVEKTYILENLCCANCAAKIEEKLNSLPEIEKAVIVFPTRQLRLTAKNPDSLITKLEKLARTVEPGISIQSGKAEPEKEEKGFWEILLGGIFFAAGLVARQLLPQFPSGCDPRHPWFRSLFCHRCYTHSCMCRLLYSFLP